MFQHHWDIKPRGAIQVNQYHGTVGGLVAVDFDFFDFGFDQPSSEIGHFRRVINYFATLFLVHSPGLGVLSGLRVDLRIKSPLRCPTNEILYPVTMGPIEHILAADLLGVTLCHT